ncbi:MAG: hypothetical protein ABL876_14125 [Chitinophagaceae bacterium]
MQFIYRDMDENPEKICLYPAMARMDSMFHQGFDPYLFWFTRRPYPVFTFTFLTYPNVRFSIPRCVSLSSITNHYNYKWRF